MSSETWKFVDEYRYLKGKDLGMKQLHEICGDLEKHSETIESKDLHNKIRIITRHFKQKMRAISISRGESVSEKSILTYML